MSNQVAVLAWQAAAEYVAVTLGSALRSAGQSLESLAALAEEHWVAIALGAFAVFLLWRVLFSRR